MHVSEGRKKKHFSNFNDCKTGFLFAVKVADHRGYFGLKFSHDTVASYYADRNMFREFECNRLDDDAADIDSRQDDDPVSPPGSSSSASGGSSDDEPITRPRKEPDPLAVVQLLGGGYSNRTAANPPRYVTVFLQTYTPCFHHN